LIIDVEAHAHRHERIVLMIIKSNKFHQPARCKCAVRIADGVRPQVRCGYTREWDLLQVVAEWPSLEAP
jgi:hypothetical protein